MTVKGTGITHRLLHYYKNNIWSTVRCVTVCLESRLAEQACSFHENSAIILPNHVKRIRNTWSKEMLRRLKFLWQWNFTCSWSDCENGQSARWSPKSRINIMLSSSVDPEEISLLQHVTHGDSTPIMINLIGAQQKHISEGKRICYTPKNTRSYQTYGNPRGWTKYRHASLKEGDTFWEMRR